VRDTRESFAHSYFGDGGGLWLAQTAEGTVGCIALRPLALPERFGPQPCGEVKRLYVQPRWRGHGIAEALLWELESFARSRGYRSLYLDTKEDLQAAIRFYLHHGFDPCERYNDNPQATRFMRKALE
jgi:GNAT superfamily N-acetyltransferase